MKGNRNDCHLCRDKLQRFIDGNLSEQEMGWVEEHLSICDECFSLYFDMVERKVVEEERELYLLGRSVMGLVSAPNPKVEEQVDKISLKLLEFGEERGVSLVLIEAEPEQEREALLMQLKVIGRLKEWGVEPILCSFERLPEVLSESADLPSPIYIFVQGLAPLSQLEEVFGTLNAEDRSLIALLIVERGEAPLPFRSSLFTLPFRPSKEITESYINEEIKSQKEKLSDPSLKEAFKYVCLLDTWGVSSPLSLVARLTGMSEEKMENIIDVPPRLIFRRDDDPSLLTTKGSLMARKLLYSLIPEEDNIPEVYIKLIRTVSEDRPEERCCVLTLLQRWMEEGRCSWAKRTVMETQEDLKRIWRSGTPQEILFWGKLLGEMKLFKRGEKIFEHGLDLDPENPFILHAYAKMLGDWAVADESVRSEKAERARELFKRIIRREDNIYTYQAWGHMESELGNYNEAERLFEEALRIDPDNPFLLVAYGEMRADSWDYEEAESLIRKAISVDPQNVYAHTTYGDLLARMLRFSEAEEQFRKAVKIDPRSFVTYNAWGVMLIRRGHWRKAEELLKMALSIHPENVQSLHALAELFTEEGRYEKARARFQMISKLEEPYINIRTLVAMAVMEGKAENYGRAEELFSQARNLSPQNAYVFAAWGEMLLRKGDLDEAKRKIDEAWDIDYKTPAIRNIRCKLLAAMERLEEARAIFKTTARRARYLDLIITYNTWADIEERAGDLERAEELRRRAYEMDPENTYTLEAYSRLLERKRELEKAREYVKTIRGLCDKEG